MDFEETDEFVSKTKAWDALWTVPPDLVEELKLLRELRKNVDAMIGDYIFCYDPEYVNMVTVSIRGDLYYPVYKTFQKLKEI